MVHWKQNLLRVWIAQFLATAGFCFATPFIPFYIKEIGVSDPAQASMWVALFAAAGNLALFLSAPCWGFISDIYGRRLMVLRASFVCGMLMPLMAFVPGVKSLVLIRFLVGLFAGTVTASQILVSSNTPMESRGFALGTLSSAVFGGRMAGTFLGGLVVDAFGYRAAFFICGITLVSAGFIVLLGVAETFEKTTTLRRKMTGFKFRLPDFGEVWWILLLVMLMGFAVRFDAPFMPLLVETINGPHKAATWTGIIGSLSAVTGIFAGPLLGWLADRSSPQRIAMWSAGMAGLLMIPQGLATSLATLAVARLGMVFFASGLMSVFQIWLAKSTPDSKRGTLFGWATSVKSCGWFLCSLAGGAVAVKLGVRWVYFCAAIVFIALAPGIALVTTLSNRRRRTAETGDSAASAPATPSHRPPRG
ncbi:MAG: MFS transporter [Lentisphaerae bacterium]|jgi:MFS transporter, DHA1 family, multidrug resistance protein|nr:MFS transporter [Lentisphaerota bacterium]MBT5609507.1 MFS transporter [Lentisphaerota bacterium]MBT7061655.1 MFS transporter [Lentisphaerota bacterium]MBT7846526.1 MFS transporter [Lentisphaerota bacterium]